MCEGANVISLLLQVTGTELTKELRQFLVESVYWTCIGLYHKELD